VRRIASQGPSRTGCGRRAALPFEAELSKGTPKKTECASRQERDMAIDTSKGHPAMDYREHLGTYAGFLTFLKVSIILLVILLAGMGYFLT
jgi:hypothetical protein